MLFFNLTGYYIAIMWYFQPLNCNIRQLVGLFSFLIRKFQSSEDYSTSDHRKLDMDGEVPIF